MGAQSQSSSVVSNLSAFASRAKARIAELVRGSGSKTAVHGGGGFEMDGLERRTMLDADLAVTALTAGNVVVGQTGGALSGSFTLRNLGTTNATGFSYRVLLSQDRSRSDNDILVSSTNVTALNANGTLTVSLAGFTVPSGANPGQYNVIVQVVPNENQTDTTSSNNVRVAERPSVTVNGLSTATNLAASISYTPGSVLPSGSLTFTTTIRNTTNVAVGSGFSASWVLSRNNVIGDADDIEITSETFTAEQGPGANGSIELTRTVQLPQGVALGEYFLGVRVDSESEVDERTENDNTATGAAANVIVTRPNLTGSLSFTGGSFAPGSAINATFTIRNTSTLPALGNFNVFVCLSPNGTAGDGDDILLQVVPFVAGGDNVSLAAGASRTFTNVPVFVPATIAPGSYRLVLLIDAPGAETPAGAVVESNEQDNNFISPAANVVVPAFTAPNPARPDFTARLQGISGTFAPGSTISYTATIANVGNASGAAPYRLVLSTNNTFSNDDIVLVSDIAGFDSEDPQAPGSSTISGTAQLPTDLTSGNYFVLLVANPGNVVEEVSTGNNVSATAAATLAVVRPVVTIRATDAAAGEVPNGSAANPGRFVISRAGATAGAVTVNFVVSGTALRATDYALVALTAGAQLTLNEDGTGSVTLPNGVASVELALNVIDDATAEAAETAIVTLSPSITYDLGAVATRGATVTIADNEPTVTVTASDTAASETAGTVTANPGRFTFTRVGGDRNQPLVVAFDVLGTAARPADYTLSAIAGAALSFDPETGVGSITIPAGAASVDLVVTVVDDSPAEDPETVLVNVRTSSNYTANAAQVATVTITDNEPIVTVAASDAAAGETNSGAANGGTFRFTRGSGNTAGALTVNFTFAGTATRVDDYAFAAIAGANLVVNNDGTGTITIPAGALFVDLNVTVVNDALAEVPETVIVGVGTSENYRRGTEAQRTATVTIADNEPTVTVVASDAAAGEVNTGSANTGTFRFTRSVGSAQSQVVNFTWAGTATRVDDYAFSAIAGANLVVNNDGTGTITIPANVTSVDLVVTAVNDSLAEVSETVIVGVAESTQYNRGTQAQRTATVTIADNEPTIVVVASDAAAGEVATGTANTGTFRFTRSAASAQAQVVNFTWAGTATRTDDYSFSAIAGANLVVNNDGTGTITIPANVTSVDLVINVVDDTTAEDPETVIVGVASSTAYNRGTDAQRTGTVTIADNEPLVIVAATDNAAAEVNSGTANTGTFRFTRDGGNRAQPLVVSFTFAGTATRVSDYAFSAIAGASLVVNNDGTGTITIPANSATVDLVVTAVNDTVAEVAETVIVNVVGTSTYRRGTTEAARTATVTIADNEPLIAIRATDATASETATGATANTGSITLTRSATGTTQVVRFQVAESSTATFGTDFTLSSPTAGASFTYDPETNIGTVTFTASVASVVIVVTPVVDTVSESAELVTLNVLAAAEGQAEYRLPAVNAASVTINNVNFRDLRLVSIAPQTTTVFTTTSQGTITLSGSVANSGATVNSYRLLARLVRIGSTASFNLGTFTVNRSVAGGAVDEFNIPVSLANVPGDPTAGSYRVQVTVEPVSTGGVADATPANNIFVVDQQIVVVSSTAQTNADLSATGVSNLNRTTFDISQATQRVATFNVGVRNLSNVASNATDIRVVLSTNSTFGDEDDIEVGVFGVPGLTPSATATTFPVSVNLEGRAPGTYFIGYRVAPTGGFNTDPAANNNTAFSEEITIVNPLAVRDLAVTNVSSVATPNAFFGNTDGQTVDVGFSITNNSNSSGGGTYTVLLRPVGGDGSTDVQLTTGQVSVNANATTNVNLTAVALPANLGAASYSLLVSVAASGGDNVGGNNSALSASPVFGVYSSPISVLVSNSGGRAVESAAGNQNGQVTFTRVGNISAPLTVPITVVAGSTTATSGVDFTALPSTITFAAGALNAVLTIPILTDADDAEVEETIRVGFANNANLSFAGSQFVDVSLIDTATYDVQALSITESAVSYSRSGPPAVDLPVVSFINNSLFRVTGLTFRRFMVGGDGTEYEIGSASTNQVLNPGATSSGGTSISSFAFGGVPDGTYRYRIVVETTVVLPGGEVSTLNNTLTSTSAFITMTA